MEDILWCIDYLAKKNNAPIPNEDTAEKRLRWLMNISMPEDYSDEYYERQDRVLSALRDQKEIVDVNGLPFIDGRIVIYRGDITCIKADAIVNACNSRLLGCFTPLHSCIDNAIHSAAGLQVRRDLIVAMERQGHDEPVGQVKVTSGYNLPSRYIFHTVGPIVDGYVSNRQREGLKNCYLSCLKEADILHLKSIVFCSISTGIYGYPKREAAQVAVEAVREYLAENKSGLERIVFDAFTMKDEFIYQEALDDKLTLS